MRRFESQLTELRLRVLRSCLVFGLFFIALLSRANPIYLWVAEPLLRQLPDGHHMMAIGVTGPLLTPIRVTFYAAFLLSLPFMIYQVWRFVLPALYVVERRWLIRLLLSSSLLFYLGVAFAYYAVLPLLCRLLTEIIPSQVRIATDIALYFDFSMHLFFMFGFFFQIPIAIIVLCLLGIVTPQALAKKRKHFISGAFFLSMLVTPPDIFSQIALAIPMCLLFELGLFIAARCHVKSNVAGLARAEKDSADSVE